MLLPNQYLLALSLTQPWATLVLRGGKRNETRSWRTAHRGWLAIHATRGMAGMPAAAIQQVQAHPVYRTLLGDLPAAQLPRGVVLGVVWLADVLPVSPEHLPTEPERSLGLYLPGRYIWRLGEVWALPAPVPARGRPGLWRWLPPADAGNLLRVA